MTADLLQIGGEKLKLWREKPKVFVRELFNVTPDPWQDDALDAFPTCPRLAMQACTGPGKLERNNNIIETPIGPRRFGDLRPGDFVFAEDGSPTQVTRIFPQGVKPIYRIIFDDGSVAHAGGEHLWKVRGRTERRHFKNRQSQDWTEEKERRAIAQGGQVTPPDGYSVLSTEQIIARGVRLASHNNRPQFEIPRQGAAQFLCVEQPIHPYLCGIWIGDGSKGQPSYTKPYVEIEQKLNDIGYSTSRAADGKHVRILNSVSGFMKLDCINCGSHERFIPDNYKYASIEQRRDLLCGLMDSDGCIGKDAHMEYDTTSERLAHDVVWLVRSLGGVAVLKDAIKRGRYRDETGEMIECRDCYRVTVVLPFNPFAIAHKAERWRDPSRAANTLRYMTRFIVSIEPAGEEECMCIEVDHPSHCYLTNDFIVTHNTAVLAWLGWNFMLTRPHSYVACTSITGDNLKSNLWTEFSRWQDRAPILKAWFTKTGERITANVSPSTWKLEARKWAKDADATQIGNALAGVHAEYVMWLLDESGDYPDAIMPTCEAIFSGEPKEAHIVQAGNPTRRGGPLFRAAFDRTGLWKVIRITADPDDPKRTPRVSIEHARNQIEQWGRDNPWVKVKIFGEFPDSDFNALIGADEVMASFRRYIPQPVGARIIGVDTALYGDDSSVLYRRHGLQCFKPIKLRNIEPTQGAGVVAREWENWQADAVFIDSTGGFGSGWIDQLRNLGRQPFGINFSAEAHLKERYYNKRAEMYFEAVEWVKRGGALFESTEMLAALTNTTYVVKNNRLLLEPKEDIKLKLGYSPDEADAFVLTFAEPVAPNTRRRAARRPVENYDPFASATERNYDPGHDYDPFR
jgi:phage terminase large subunit